MPLVLADIDAGKQFWAGIVFAKCKHIEAVN
jgi:hypothetical protein